MNFNDNIGTADRVLRIAVGLVLIIATLFGYIGAWGWIGIAPLLTAVFAFCPLYRVVKLDTLGRRGR